MSRLRLDVALMERGLAPSRARAHAAVMAGRVRVDGVRVDKPGTAVGSGAQLSVEDAPEFASRGGVKLQNALDGLGIDVAGARALDLGASTGGFTDCLLRRGAAAVVAVDVGYGQLDWRLRGDGRVHVLERTNARELTPAALPYAADLVVADLAFISLATVWPAVAPCLAPGWRALVLVKPQFELDRGAVGSGGVVRDPLLRAEAARRVARALALGGGAVEAACDSGLPGPKGNREIFLLARDAAVARPADVEQAILEAVGAAEAVAT